MAEHTPRTDDYVDTLEKHMRFLEAQIGKHAIEALQSAWKIEYLEMKVKHAEDHGRLLEKHLEETRAAARKLVGIEPPPDHATLREALAEYAHNAWSGWMKYMFSKGERRGQFKVGSEGEIDVSWIMPPWAVERWTRQMNTPYDQLPQEEKESDRVEADAMLAVIRGKAAQ